MDRIPTPNHEHNNAMHVRPSICFSIHTSMPFLCLQTHQDQSYKWILKYLVLKILVGFIDRCSIIKFSLMKDSVMLTIRISLHCATQSWLVHFTVSVSRSTRSYGLATSFDRLFSPNLKIDLSHAVSLRDLSSVLKTHIKLSLWVWHTLLPRRTPGTNRSNTSVQHFKHFAHSRNIQVVSPRTRNIQVVSVKSSQVTKHSIGFKFGWKRSSRFSRSCCYKLHSTSFHSLFSVTEELKKTFHKQLSEISSSKIFKRRNLIDHSQRVYNDYTSSSFFPSSQAS